MDNNAYHAHPGIGSSTLKRILTSPDHMRNGLPPSCIDALALGTAIHTRTLEPDLPIIIAPDLKLTSKSNKLEAVQWIIANKGTVPHENTADAIKSAYDTVPNAMRADHAAIAADVAMSVWDSERARGLLTGAKIEQSLFSGKYKARPDAYHSSSALLIDLKSTRDVTHHQFASSAERLRYPFSLAHYEWVMGMADMAWFWIVVGTTPDRERNGRKIYPVEVYEADEEMKAASRADAEKARALYEQCLADNTWPAPPEPTTATLLSRPGWATEDNNTIDLGGLDHE